TVVQGPKYLGYVGEIRLVDPTLITALSQSGFIPVIAPLGMDVEGQIYNINADTAAGAVAGAVGTKRLIM
ncbi:hypothetical protein LKX83_33725, partial [Cohnella sp. REN36]|nr:hypothetical protein [Cohnella sp. REN36]